MKILTRLPFSDKPTTISFGNYVGYARPFQIVLWISLRTRDRETSAFPVVLDTGLNHSFAISADYLRDWGGMDYQSLPSLPGVKLGRQLLPRREATLLIHRNVPGKAAIAAQPPYLLQNFSGVIIQHGDAVTRLPTLGMRALVENGLRLWVDGKRKHVNLQTGILW